MKAKVRMYKPLDKQKKVNRKFTNMEAEAVRYMRQNEEYNPHRLTTWLMRNFHVQYTTQGVPMSKWNEPFEYMSTFFFECAMVFTGKRPRASLPYGYASIKESKRGLYDYVVTFNTNLPLIIFKTK